MSLPKCLHLADCLLDYLLDSPLPPLLSADRAMISNNVMFQRLQSDSPNASDRDGCGCGASHSPTPLPQADQSQLGVVQPIVIMSNFYSPLNG